MNPIIFLLFIHTYSFAQEITKEVWSHKQHHFLMASIDNGKILISENCVDHNSAKNKSQDKSQDKYLEKSHCEAAKIFKQAPSININAKDFSGGKNPGAVICRDYLKQNVVILKDPDQNENAFCQFADRSMISAITLTKLIKRI